MLARKSEPEDRTKHDPKVVVRAVVIVDVVADVRAVTLRFLEGLLEVHVSSAEAVSALAPVPGGPTSRQVGKTPPRQFSRARGPRVKECSPLSKNSNQVGRIFRIEGSS